MPFDPTGNIQGSPDMSPTTLILNQLKARGVPLNAANVRAAVLANAREGQQAGPDPVAGLRSMAPISNAGDPGVGQSGNVAKKVAPGGGRGGRSRGGATPPMDRRDNTSSGAPKTSAPPGPDATYQGPSLDDLILPLAAGSGAVGLGEYARRRAMGGQDFMGNKPMDPTGRMIDINLPGIEGPNIDGAGSQLPQPSIRPGIEGPPPQLGGPGGPQSAVGGQGAAPPVSDMEVAMQRAISPAGSGELDLGGLRPMTSPGDVRGPGLPPGVTDVDAARAGIGAGGLDQPRVAGQVGVPDVNLPARPRVSVQALPALPPSTDNMGLLRSLIEGAGSIARGVRR